MSFEDVLRRAIKSEEEEHESSGNWHPSDIGVCNRKSVLRHAGVESGGYSDETLRNFWMGKLIHERLLRALKAEDPARTWVDLPDDTPIHVRDEQYKVHGIMDALKQTDEGYEVYEFKSQKDHAFDSPLPKPEHVLQVACYLAFPARDPRNPEIELPLPDLARIIYWGKGNARIGEYVVSRNEMLSTTVRALLLELESAFRLFLETGALPPALLPKVPLKDRQGNVLTYVKSGKWGKAGDAKMQDDPRINYCDYKGTGKCCGD